MRRRAAYGVAGIAAEPHQSKAGGDGRRGPAAGSGSHAIERVRIPRVARQNGVHGFIRTEGPFGHVGLGENQSARLLDALDLEGVFIGDVAGQGERAVGGLQSLRFEVILDDHRHAVQRSGQAGLGKTAIQFLGLFFDIGVNQDQGVDRRAVLVKGGNAL